MLTLRKSGSNYHQILNTRVMINKIENDNSSVTKVKSKLKQLWMPLMLVHLLILPQARSNLMMNSFAPFVTLSLKTLMM